MKPKTAILILLIISLIGLSVIYILATYMKPIQKSDILDVKKAEDTVDKDDGVSPIEVDELYKDLEKYKEEQADEKPYEQKTAEEKLKTLMELEAIVEATKKAESDNESEDIISMKEKLKALEETVEASKLEIKEIEISGENTETTYSEKTAEEKAAFLKELEESFKNN